MKRYVNYYEWGMYDRKDGEWVKYSEVKESLEIINKSLIAKDYIGVEELLSEILEDE